MWHRFSQPLRQLVVAALREAARAGHAEAQPQDFLAGLAQSDVAPINMISREAKELFEQAYREAAKSKDRFIGIQHLRPDFPRESAPFLASFRKQFGKLIALYKIHVKLSAMHPKLVDDPHPIYDRIRAIAPVRRDPLVPVWIVTGYAEAAAVLRDPDFSSEPRARNASGMLDIEMLPAGPVREELCVIGNVLARMMVFSDPPMHGQIRGEFGHSFFSRNNPALRERLQSVADELIDEVAPRGRMDFVQDFAHPLPLRVVTEMIGFPASDIPKLKQWSEKFGTLIAVNPSIAEELECRRAILEMRNYFDGILAERRAAEGSLLSVSRRIDSNQVFANCVFLLAAGHETTANVLGSSLRILLNHPQELQRLIDDSSLMPGAVEELLRLAPAVEWTTRRAKKDLQLGEQTIPRNALVRVSIAAANRDPKQFPDPHCVDITRANANKHLAFSAGNHFCLGANVARMELEIGLATVLRRLKNLRIEKGFEVTWRPGRTLRGFANLPVTFDVAEPARGGYVSPEAT